jgi:hypothetical protein
MRRLHGAGGRGRDALVPVPGRAAREREDHDHRGGRAGRGRPQGRGRLGRWPSSAMRLPLVGTGDGRDRAAEGDAEADGPGHHRRDDQSLPLRASGARPPARCRTRRVGPSSPPWPKTPPSRAASPAARLRRPLPARPSCSQDESVSASRPILSTSNLGPLRTGRARVVRSSRSPLSPPASAVDHADAGLPKRNINANEAPHARDLRFKAGRSGTLGQGRVRPSLPPPPRNGLATAAPAISDETRHSSFFACAHPLTVYMMIIIQNGFGPLRRRIQATG